MIANHRYFFIHLVINEYPEVHCISETKIQIYLSNICKAQDS